MRALTRIAAAGVGVAGGVAVGRALATRKAPSEEPESWHVLTVFRPLDEVTGHLPAMPDGVEVRLRAAPAGRGTEIAARGPDARQIRRALREARSILEVGEVLEPGGPTTEPTPLNKPLRTATEHGREGGLL